MNSSPLSFVVYIAVCLVSSAFLWRKFQKASSSQRRKMAFAVLGALGVVLLAILLHALR
ncbi:hypothetical protein [Prosthecobacter sp.]|uniref:hypothetical protein n=1 Tax=Prosthecobacter sp. TaxID=1965333 RepID=UPI003783FE62